VLRDEENCLAREDNREFVVEVVVVVGDRGEILKLVRVKGAANLFMRNKGNRRTPIAMRGGRKGYLCDKAVRDLGGFMREGKRNDSDVLEAPVPCLGGGEELQHLFCTAITNRGWPGASRRPAAVINKHFT
jgi:hypothetical protein